MPGLRAWLLNRDRSLLLGGCVLIAGIAWLSMIRMAAAPGHHAGHRIQSGVVHSGMAHSTPDLWSLFLMWAVMMVAMMLPAALPFILTFGAEQARRRSRRMTAVPTALFVIGYFAIWTVFSAACALLQTFLHRTGLLSPAMSLTSWGLSGTVLIAAGLYQWTPLKNACLHHCRSPLTFLLSDWREGRAGAFRMGLLHGIFCLGCCWMLMLLPFAAGVMNLLLMAGITILLLLEKAAPGGEWTARLCGALLVLTGALVIRFGFGPGIGS